MTVDAEGQIPRRRQRIRLVRWLNVPRRPPFDRYGIPRGVIKVSKAFYRNKLESVFDFTWPAVYWFVAKQFAGKSVGVEDVMLEYIDHGGKAIDCYSADDDEGLGWLIWLETAPEGTKVLLLCGNKVDLVFREGSRAKALYDSGKLEWKHFGDLRSRTPEQVRESFGILEPYKVVLTVPAFFYNANEMFLSLSSLIDLMKQRGRVVWSKNGRREVYCVGIRESKVLLASRYYAGKIVSRQDAEMDLVDLVDKAFHTGVAEVFDSLRYMSITPDVREITHHTMIKKLGKMKLPPEFKYVLRYANPRWLRRMRRGMFCLYTDEDDVFVGVNDPVPWHIERGTAPLLDLGIDVVVVDRKAKPAVPEEATEQSRISDGGERKWKVSQAIHGRIWRLVNDEGLSYGSTREKLEEGDDVEPADPVKLSVATVFNEAKAHREHLCMCPDEPEEEEGGK
jgi:hypothetical protein